MPDYAQADAVSWARRVIQALGSAARGSGDWDYFSRCEAAEAALETAVRLLQDAAERPAVHERSATRTEHMRHGASVVRYLAVPYQIHICRVCGRPLSECGAKSDAACKHAQAAGEHR